MQENFFQKEVGKLKSELFATEYLYEQAKLAKSFVDTHYSKNIDADDIAGRAFLSKFHFIRVFNSIYGVTPHQYLTGTRIERAKGLLQSGKSIQQTCSMVGFRSITSFAGLFKKTTGITPAAFQQRPPSAPCSPLPLKLAANYKKPQF